MRSDTAQLHAAEPEMPTERAARLVRLAGWALVTAVAAAAVWAVVELLSRDVTETDARVIVTSLGFAAASTTGASGVAALMRDSAGLRALGVAALGCSIAAFLLFAWIVWEIEFLYDIGVPEWGWRACGCSTVLAIAFGHASLMLRGRRPTDTGLVQVVTGLSLLCSAIDAGGALLWLTKIIDHVDQSWARILGAVLVLLIATTMLAPLLRRLRLASARDRPQQMTELAA